MCPNETHKFDLQMTRTHGTQAIKFQEIMDSVSLRITIRWLFATLSNMRDRTFSKIFVMLSSALKFH